MLDYDYMPSDFIFKASGNVKNIKHLNKYNFKFILYNLNIGTQKCLIHKTKAFLITQKLRTISYRILKPLN